MKKLIYLLLAAGLIAGCGLSGHSDLSGRLIGIKSDTLLIESVNLNNRYDYRLDTVAMNDGEFELNLGDSVLKEVYIYGKLSSKHRFDPMQLYMSRKCINLLLLPGQPVYVEGAVNYHRVKGGKFYEEYSEVYDRMLMFRYKIDSIKYLCTEMKWRKMHPDTIRKASAPVEELEKELKQIQVDYVKQHPDRESAVYVMSKLPIDEIGDLLGLIDEKTRSGRMAPLYDFLKNYYEQETARKQSAGRMKPGGQAPDFTLNDTVGQPFTLSSLYGKKKHIVVYFWGTWSSLVTDELPKVKEAYAKYKDQVEIVGVCTGHDAEEWKEAVKKYRLDWINVFNSKNPDVSILYGIKGYPAKIVLDEHGKIVENISGDNLEFYKLLEKLIGE